jgi:hypothetical protein
MTTGRTDAARREQSRVEGGAQTLERIAEYLAGVALG